MKRYILFFLCVLVSLFTDAKSAEWIEVQSVIIPNDTVINYTVSEKGKINFFIIVDGLSISVSRSNAEKFIQGECQLEVVKWCNRVNGKFKYTTRRHNDKNKDIDLNKATFKKYG